MSAAPVLARRRPCVVLGVAPAAAGEPAWAVGSRSGARLAKLAGIDLGSPPRAKTPAQERLRAAFALDNLVPYPEPSRQALKDAAQLYRFLPGFWYVLAGTEVVRALGRRALLRRPDIAVPWSLTGPRPLVWYETREGVTVAILPHPSGRNRWYNDAYCKDAAQEFLRAARWQSRGNKAHTMFEAARREAR